MPTTDVTLPPEIADATALLPQDMPEERRALIQAKLLEVAKSHRYENVDFSFGDKEIYWYPPEAPSEDSDASEEDLTASETASEAEEEPDPMLAEGYDGSGAYFSLYAEDRGDLFTWDYDPEKKDQDPRMRQVVWALLDLGLLGGRSRNDSSVDLYAHQELWLAEREV